MEAPAAQVEVELLLSDKTISAASIPLNVSVSVRALANTSAWGALVGDATPNHPQILRHILGDRGHLSRGDGWLVLGVHRLNLLGLTDLEHTIAA